MNGALCASAHAPTFSNTPPQKKKKKKSGRARAHAVKSFSGGLTFEYLSGCSKKTPENGERWFAVLGENEQASRIG